MWHLLLLFQNKTQYLIKHIIKRNWYASAYFIIEFVHIFLVCFKLQNHIKVFSLTFVLLYYSDCIIPDLAANSTGSVFFAAELTMYVFPIVSTL